MKRNVISVITLITITVMLTGCWSRHELNDLGITLGVGIDKQDGKYLVTAQVVIPEAISAKKGEHGAPATMVQESGTTVAEAFRKMTIHTSRKIYLSHLRTLVISEEVAREGIKNVLDFFKRNRELRPDFYITIAKGSKAHQALSVIPRLERVPAERVFRSLELSEKEWAPTTGVFLDELTTNIVSKGKEAVLTGMQTIGDVERGNTMHNTERLSDVAVTRFSSLGVFKKDKLIGWLNEEESKGYNYVEDKVKRTQGFIACPKGKGNIGVDVNQSTTDMKASVKDGNPEITVKIELEQSIVDVQCDVDLTKIDIIYELERESKQKVENFVEKTIRKVQKDFKSDIFGFGEAIHREDPKYWAKVEDHWDEEFAKLPVRVDVDVKIRRTGTETNSFITELEKKE